MAHWCDTCGQQLPAEGNHADAQWLGAPGDEPIHNHSPSGHAGQDKAGRDRKLFLAVGGAVVIWALFVLVGRLLSPADPVADEDPAQDGTAAETAEPAESDDTYQAADSAPNAPVDENANDLSAIGEPESDEFAVGSDDSAEPLGARAVTSLQVERLQRQLGRRASNAFIAYESVEGVVVIDLQAATTDLADLTTGATTADAGIELLRSGASTFGIDPTTMTIGQIVDDSSIVVTKARSGDRFFVDASSMQTFAPVIQALSGDDVSEYITPRGYQLLPLDGLGLVAVPKGPSGDSLVAGPVGFETLSAHRVLTGNQNALLEQRCETPITCDLVVLENESETEWLLPADYVKLGDNYVLSPDGIQLLRYTAEGFSEVLHVRDGSLAFVTGGGMEAPAWGPNSDFIAWLDRVGNPTLKVMFPDERDWLTIDLADLGAPPPLRQELIVFAPPGTGI